MRRQIAQQKAADKKRAARLRQLNNNLKKLSRLKVYTPKGTAPTKHGKHLASQLKDVLEGRATIHKVTPRDARVFKKQGRTVVKGHVVIPKEEGATYFARGGTLYRREQIGNKTRTAEIHPASGTDVQSYLEAVSRDPQWQKWLADPEHIISFKFFGHRTFESFDSIEGAIRFFKTYDTVKLAEKKGSSEDMEEIIENIEFIRTTRGAAHKFEVDHAANRERRRKRHVSRKVRFERLKKNPTALIMRVRQEKAYEKSRNASERRKAYKVAWQRRQRERKSK